LRPDAYGHAKRWAIFGIQTADNIQLPHRHQSVALDLIIDCKPDCYTLVGNELDEHGRKVDPQTGRLEIGLGFVTPPGY
jgi:hypothetical protein